MIFLAGTAAAAASAIVIIWFGYPLLVWVAAVVAGKPLVPGNGRGRRVSVILATRDVASVVRARVANLLETDHPADAMQVIVALDADGSRSTVSELAMQDSRVIVIEGDAPGGKAAALNAGVRAANGDVLVMADAQQRYDARTIPSLVDALEDQRFGAVSGALTLGGNALSPVHMYWAMEKWLRHNESRLHSSVGVTGAVYAVRRALWPVVPPGTLLDDVYVPMTLVMRGHRIGFSYDARAWDAREFDSNAESVRKTRTLTGVLQLKHLIPGLLSPIRNPIWLQFVAHKLLRLLTPLFAAIAALSLAALFALLLAQAGTRTRLYVLAGVAILLAVPRVRRMLLGTAKWVYAMQSATVRATVNGMRARWQVWSR